MVWWPALLGWPAIALSVVLAVTGLMRRKEHLVLLAIVPLIPIGFYVLGSPLYWWLPIVVLIGLLLLSWSIHRAKRKSWNPD